MRSGGCRGVAVGVVDDGMGQPTMETEGVGGRSFDAVDKFGGVGFTRKEAEVFVSLWEEAWWLRTTEKLVDPSEEDDWLCRVETVDVSRWL
ncbi:unnamed protein product [Vicia faba]|uniref:Uncharacterized protein n=1 Tax=Vicia faba TaxID=3906 RepID=A0AAV0ZKI1_VICFA|nr:unnamed protein product [Vicia faba]